MIQRRKPLKRSTKPLSRTARLRRVSKKRGKALREYARLRAKFLFEHPTCQVIYLVSGPSVKTAFREECGRPSCDIHHKAGRGKNLCNVATWMSVCRACHDLIHRDPKWARERGYLI